MSDPIPGLAAARALLAAARHVLVLTGAGISAESGLPTFRDDQGYWAKFDPRVLASMPGFRKDPVGVWQWYEERRRRARAVVPNAAHLALAAYALRRPGQVTIVTQNVDALHTRAAHAAAAAGDPAPALPLEYHGSLFALKCPGCGRPTNDSGDLDIVDDASLPRCAHCNARLRPGVVWFGDPIPDLVAHAAQRAAETADGCLVIGTSAEVYPAANLPEGVKNRGGWLIEINPEPTGLSPRADHCLRAPAGQAVPALLAVG